MNCWQKIGMWLLLSIILWQPLSVFGRIGLLKAMMLAFVLVRAYVLFASKEPDPRRLTGDLGNRE